MTTVLVFIGVAAVALVAAGGISLGAVLALHQLALLRVPGRDEVVASTLADFMVDPVPVAEPEHPLDRLARHCDVKIVEPSHVGSSAARPAPRDDKAGHPHTRREAASHAEKGTR
jgi:hypothetical protein